MIYQGIGLLTGEGSVGLVSEPQNASNAHKCAPEAGEQSSEAEEECRVCRVFPSSLQSENKGSSIEENREKPYTPYTSSSTVNVHKPASEADAKPQDAATQPDTDPTRGKEDPTREGEWEEFIL